MTARKYSSSENTLPAYDKNNLGDMIVGIKAALITGYKDIPSEGWELLYESIGNTSDISKRIVIRSKAVDSEQKVFEITDISNTEGSIKCWENWQNGAGVTLLMQAKINKNCWGTDLEIIADDKFVHLIVNAVYHGFGDVDVFDTTKPKTVLFNMKGTGSDTSLNSIASTNNPSRNVFIDKNNTYVCRSFSNEVQGYGSNTAYNTTVADTFFGGDTYNTPSNILSPVHKTELLLKNGSIYSFFGFLPMLVHTDNPVTMAGKNIMIDGKSKKIIKIFATGMAYATYVVDV